MRTLQVRFVCNHILIDFEQSDLFRMLFQRNGIQRQHSWRNTKEIYGRGVIAGHSIDSKANLGG